MRNRCACVRVCVSVIVRVYATIDLGKGQLWVAVGSQLSVQRSCVCACVVIA